MFLLDVCRLNSSPCEGLAEADDPEDTEVKGYIFTLPDGVSSRFRYYLFDGHAVAHFRVPSRDIMEKPEFSLQTCAEHVANACAKPHSILEMTEDVRGVFLGYQTLLNVKSNAAAQAAPGFHQFTFLLRGTKPPTAFTLMFNFSGGLVSYISVLAISSKPDCVFLCSRVLD